MGQGRYRVLLKWLAMVSYTEWTNAVSNPSGSVDAPAAAGGPSAIPTAQQGLWEGGSKGARHEEHFTGNGAGGFCLR